ESFLQSQYLRKAGDKLSLKKQLQLIMNQSTVGQELLHEWRARFAAQHGLDHVRAIELSHRPYFRQQLSSVRQKLMNLVGRYRVDASYDLALRDVFEASLAAATILATRPGRTASIARTIRRVATRGPQTRQQRHGAPGPQMGGLRGPA